MSDLNWQAERGLRQKAGNEPTYDPGCQSWGRLDPADGGGSIKCYEPTGHKGRHAHGNWAWGDDRRVHKEVRMLHTIWDVYNHLKKRRDTLRVILEAIERDTVTDATTQASYNEITIEEEFLTNTLAMIDHGRGLPSEDEQ